MLAPDDPEWGICDRDLVSDEFWDDDDGDDDEWDEFRALYGEGDESIPELMNRAAAEIRAGREEMPLGWKLVWPSPEVLVWTTPSGRRRASILTGQWLPDGMA
jgi:hypothetical protein